MTTEVTSIEQLTEGERRVVGHCLQGKTDREIAAALNITKSAVKFHLRNTYRKCGVHSRVQLILKLAVRGAA